MSSSRKMQEEEHIVTSGRGSISDNDETRAKYYRQVSIPKKATFIEGFKSTVRETLFPEGTFQKLPKGASSSTTSPRRSIYLALANIFPILHWIHDYSVNTFKDDLIAGLTIGSLSIPQDIGNAKLAGLPPIYGLCKSILLVSTISI